jgi:protein involved in polysaccharide export with SLBB domain
MGQQWLCLAKRLERGPFFGIMIATALRRLRDGVALAIVGGLAAASPAHGQDSVEDAVRKAATTRLRPGDQIALHFVKDKDLSQTVTVNERGEAVFPKLGTMSVGELSIAQLQDTLRVRYLEYLRAPEFEVSVLRRVAVNGEVRMPNVYMVDAATTLRDVIARAGGLTENGSRGKVSILRGSTRIRVKDWDAPTGPATSLESGDQVFVGRKPWLVINALPVIATAVSVTSLAVAIHRR